MAPPSLRYAVGGTYMRVASLAYDLPRSSPWSGSFVAHPHGAELAAEALRGDR